MADHSRTGYAGEATAAYRCAVPVPSRIPSAMTKAEQLRTELLAVSAAEQFTFAVMQFRDGSRLHFCHRVDERWVHAIGPAAPGADAGLAGELRGAIRTFRLNAKHLDIQFADGSRWEEKVPCS